MQIIDRSPQGVVDAFKYYRDKGVPYYEDYETIFPYASDHIWSVILNPKYMFRWLEYCSHVGMVTNPLSEPFGVGTTIEASKVSHLETITIVDYDSQYSHEKSVTFFHPSAQPPDWDIGFTRISVQSNGQSSSNVKITFCFFRKRGFLDNFKSVAHNRKENTHILENRIKKLKQCCNEEQISG